MTKQLTTLKQDISFQIKDYFDGIPKNPLLNLEGVKKEIMDIVEESRSTSGKSTVENFRVFGDRLQQKAL